MLTSEMVDFTGSTGDVTDSAEGTQIGELKRYHSRIALSQCLTANKRFGASGGVTSNNLLCGIDRLWF